MAVLLLLFCCCHCHRFSRSLSSGALRRGGVRTIDDACLVLDDDDGDDDVRVGVRLEFAVLTVAFILPTGGDFIRFRHRGMAAWAELLSTTVVRCYCYCCFVIVFSSLSCCYCCQMARSISAMSGPRTMVIRHVATVTV